MTSSPRRGRAALPAVDELLRSPELAECWRQLGPRWSRRAAREALAEERNALATAAAGVGVPAARRGDAEAARGRVFAAARARAAALLARSLVPVLNASGTVLHTNLGRAPLAAAAAARVAELAVGYSNLEFDLASGRRGRRDLHSDALANELTGAERTLVVNNNAAAVLLLLNTLAGAPLAAAPAATPRPRGGRVRSRGEGHDEGRSGGGAFAPPPGEVLVSRGELVEIGGSFRVPDVMARSGARLVEVGTTNRTRAEDYQRALSPRTRLILRVHRSNFVQRGFVAQPSLAELVAIGRRAKIPVAEDLGSGCLAELSAAGVREPVVAASLAAGVDVVTYSGDKLLGGPQAGLISGRAKWVDPLRANPLFRALRVDRLGYAALAETLRLYALGREGEIPILRMLRASAAELEARARAFAARLDSGWRAEVRPGESVVGGGAAPEQALPAWLVVLRPEGVSARDLEAILRRGEPAVVARIHDGRVVLDLRTIPPAEEDRLARALAQAASRPREAAADAAKDA